MVALSQLVPWNTVTQLYPAIVGIKNHIWRYTKPFKGELVAFDFYIESWRTIFAVIPLICLSYFTEIYIKYKCNQLLVLSG
ncbi:hypothetical protein SAMN05216302_10634 [Nitrosomonas aestuarii]|uniref:Uncharacterized protein n=1 Tax=Nitrosomonas aestuarii TaxID=52441 RepID=A0A1I4GU02_9PROT|nr:hypothetical protein SAMN05216302_10634 [Nitrosomonas aestuarii]